MIIGKERWEEISEYVLVKLEEILTKSVEVIGEMVTRTDRKGRTVVYIGKIKFVVVQGKDGYVLSAEPAPEEEFPELVPPVITPVPGVEPATFPDVDPANDPEYDPPEPPSRPPRS